MTICEFEERYYLHDSSIEKLEYDRAEARIIMTINFCYWMQTWYVKEKYPENGLLHVKFEGITRFDYDDYASEFIFAEEPDNEILDISVDESGMLILGIEEIIDWREWKKIFYQLKIHAKNIEVEAIS